MECLYRKLVPTQGQDGTQQQRSKIAKEEDEEDKRRQSAVGSPIAALLLRDLKFREAADRADQEKYAELSASTRHAPTRTVPPSLLLRD